VDARLLRRRPLELVSAENAIRTPDLHRSGAAQEGRVSSLTSWPWWTCYLSASSIEKVLFPGEPTTGFIEGEVAAAYLDLDRIDDAIATASRALELSTQAGRTGAQAQAH
jgi:hypothetical protein